MEKSNKIGRSVMWNNIYEVLTRLDLKEISGDTLDRPSASTEIEELFLKLLPIQNVSNCFTVVKENADKYNTDNMCNQMHHCKCGNTTLSDWDKFCPKCGVKLIFQ